MPGGARTAWRMATVLVVTLCCSACPKNGSQTKQPPAKPTYVQRCEKQGVPIPPPWGTGGWKEVGDLTGKQIFISPEFDPLTIWKYEAPPPTEGLCMATVRYKKGTKKSDGKIEVIGIICQGKKTGKACFWIAKTNARGEQVKDMQNADHIPETKDGKPLNCSKCHRGSNVFIVHPDTILGTITEIDDPDKRYSPVSAQHTWNNTPPKKPYNESQCGQCHEFSKVTKQWCKFVLQKAILRTMPPKPRASNWPDNYRDDLNRFKRECKAVGYTLKLP